MIRTGPAGVAFSVRLTPKGGRDRIEGWACEAAGRTCLKVRVSAVPENGRANDALIALLAKALGVGKSRITIAKGRTARNKVLEIAGDATALKAGLEALGDCR